MPGHHDTTVRAACFHCKQPKKAFHAGSIGKPRVVAEPHLGAADIEKLIEERVASGVQKALDAQTASNESVMAGFAQHDYTGSAFGLGLGGIVADSISSLEDDEPRIPDYGEVIIDKFGNNADAYLRRSTNYCEEIEHRIAVMSCILMGTVGVCILFTYCVLFTQFASTQALNPHTIDGIGKKHAIENWNIESTLGNSTRYGLKRMAQGHQ